MGFRVWAFLGGSSGVRVVGCRVLGLEFRFRVLGLGFRCRLGVLGCCFKALHSRIIGCRTMFGTTLNVCWIEFCIFVTIEP